MIVWKHRDLKIRDENVLVTSAFLFFIRRAKIMKFKDRRLWFLIGGVVIIIFCMFIMLKSNKKVLVLKDKEVVLEYGQSISTDPKDYLSFNELDDKDKKVLLKNVKLKSNVKNEIEMIVNADGTTSEKDKGYACVGNYEVTLYYKDEIKIVKIKVRDTVAPELIAPESVEVIQGTNLINFDFKTLIKASDLSILSDYNFDFTYVDINTLGEYVAKVSVEDASKNRTEREFKVVIVSPPLENEEVVQEVFSNQDGTKSVKSTIKKKENNSSNNSKVTNSTPASNSSIDDTDTNKPIEDSSNSGSAGSDVENSGGGYYIYIYYCLNHPSQVYNNLDELINAGHYTIRANGIKFAGCNEGGYGEGEEWINN